VSFLVVIFSLATAVVIGVGVGIVAGYFGGRVDDWRRVIDVNLHGVAHGVDAAYPLMVKQGSGHIVNIASVAGLSPYPLTISYTASKHAVVGLSHALRAEGAALGVKVSVVCPGMIDTPIWRRSEIRGFNRDLLLQKIRPKMSAERCAAATLRGVERNEATIVVTAEAKAMWLAHRLSPSLSLWIHEALVKKVRGLA
jgi:short-subunit dehydrogenase